MNGREKGFLLLTSHLGDPERKILTLAQFRDLALRVRGLEGKDRASELTEEDLQSIGYNPAMAARMILLLSQEEQLDWYVREGQKRGCVPIARVSPDYPHALKERLGLESPGCLWAKGDLQLLEKPAVALVGSRELGTLNYAFAYEVGRQAALQGYVLVSGNAKGADQTAQNSCLEHGGQVISVLADRLDRQMEQERVLYLSEEGYDLDFTAIRALSRNRVIHSLPKLTLVAQCTKGKGGTWDGTVKNLKKLWSPVFCLDDGSAGIQALMELGAEPVSGAELEDLSALKPYIQNLISQ